MVPGSVAPASLLVSWMVLVAPRLTPDIHAEQVILRGHAAPVVVRPGERTGLSDLQTVRVGSKQGQTLATGGSNDIDETTPNLWMTGCPGVASGVRFGVYRDSLPSSDGDVRGV